LAGGAAGQGPRRAGHGRGGPQPRARSRPPLLLGGGHGRVRVTARIRPRRPSPRPPAAGARRPGLAAPGREARRIPRRDYGSLTVSQLLLILSLRSALTVSLPPPQLTV